MGITIGIDQNGKPFVNSQFEKELEINKDESRIAEHFILYIINMDPAADIILEQRSSNYISMCTKDYDFLRFKYTDRAKWISIDVTDLDVSADDPRFTAQANKNQRFWKANIKSVGDLCSFDSLVYDSYLHAKEGF
ncbi:MAG: hypothetical protein J6Z09_05910 [Lachnospiraceae bacterium]|nr:hypothetical protein [Lachnospiraceae bacterium]